jgi:hypothetical protein
MPLPKCPYLAFVYSKNLLSFFLSLAPQPSVGFGLLHKIRLNFLESSQQFSFLQGRVGIPTPNPHPGGPGLCIYIPQGRVATYFSRLLRHAWVTVGLYSKNHFGANFVTAHTIATGFHHRMNVRQQLLDLFTDMIHDLSA